MNQRILVSTSDPLYEKRLSNVLRKNYPQLFTVVHGDTGDVVLVDAKTKDAMAAKDKDATAIFCLTEEKTRDSGSVYRYQKAEELVQELLYKTSHSLLEKKENLLRDLYILYSPLGCKSLENVGEQYAIYREGKGEKPLLISFDPWGKRMEDGCYNLSLLCYDIYRDGVDCLTNERIFTAVERGSCHRIKGFSNPAHGWDLKEEFTKLVFWLMEKGNYDSIILVLKQLPSRCEELFCQAKEVMVFMDFMDSGQNKNEENCLQYLETIGVEKKSIKVMNPEALEDALEGDFDDELEELEYEEESSSFENEEIEEDGDAYGYENGNANRDIHRDINRDVNGDINGNITGDIMEEFDASSYDMEQEEGEWEDWKD